MSIDEIPHTAAVKIRIRAGTRNDLFSEACSALMQVMYGDDRRNGVKKTINLTAEDDETLLWDFLSEVLYVSEVENLVVSSAEVSVADHTLAADLHGEPFDRSRHSAGTEVKGISFYGLGITHDANGYMLDIVFDV